VNFEPFKKGRGLLARERRALVEAATELAKRVDELEAWKKRAEWCLNKIQCVCHDEYDCPACDARYSLLHGNGPAVVTIKPGPGSPAP
jgi:hypothetical protein